MIFLLLLLFRLHLVYQIKNCSILNIFPMGGSASEKIECIMKKFCV